MKVQIRRGVFETNSSMTHSLTIVTEEQYKEWQDNSELYFDEYNKEFCMRDDLYYRMINSKYFDKEEYNQDKENYFEGYLDDECCYTYNKYGREGLEQFTQSFITPSGDKIICFGQYGADY